MKVNYYLVIILSACVFSAISLPTTTEFTEEYSDYTKDYSYSTDETTDSTTYNTSDTTISTSTTTASTTKRSTTPRPTFHTPRTTLFERYNFESVDYNELPDELKSYNSDCYGQHIRCIRHRTDHYQVCGYNLQTGYYDDYYSPCEIELQNCHHRMKKGFGVYGTNYTNDIIFYNGEGFNCIYYLRRAKNEEEMHKLYFSDYDDDEID